MSVILEEEKKKAALPTVALILTNKMLPADVNWARARLETEGNRRCDLKST